MCNLIFFWISIVFILILTHDLWCLIFDGVFYWNGNNRLRQRPSLLWNPVLWFFSWFSIAALSRQNLWLLALILLQLAVFAVPHLNSINLLLCQRVKIFSTLRMQPATIDALVFSWLAVDHELLAVSPLTLAVKIRIDQYSLVRQNATIWSWCYGISMLYVKDSTCRRRGWNKSCWVEAGSRLTLLLTVF